MAATLTQERFGGPDWLFERKFDGIRLLAYKDGDDVRLYSRNRLPQQLPAVARAVAKLPVENAILDGEVTWDGHSGYHVFDILWLNGQPTTTLPLDALEVSKTPFTKATGLPRLRAHWVTPAIVVQVAFIEWTVHGKLRHPRLTGVRFDKNPRDVVREDR